MASKDVKPLIEKEFVDVRIDTDRTIGGNDVLKRYQEKSQGIPWFVFLDANGTALVTSTTPDGRNIGFPWEDFEIAHFIVMLEKVRRHLTAEEVEFLKQSLIANRAKKQSQNPSSTVQSSHWADRRASAVAWSTP
jgi:hypothetical protein